MPTESDTAGFDGWTREDCFQWTVGVVTVQQRETEKYRLLSDEYRHACEGYRRRNVKLEQQLEKTRRELTLACNARDDAVAALTEITRRLTNHVIGREILAPDTSPDLNGGAK